MKEAFALLDPYHGGLRAYGGNAIPRAVLIEWARQIEANPLIARFAPHEQERLKREIYADTASQRRVSAGVARYRAQPVRQMVAKGRAEEAAMRRDVLRTFPDALNNVTPGDLINIARFERELLRDLPDESMTAVFTMMEPLLKEANIVSFVRLRAIEELSATGRLRIATDEDRLVSKHLREWIEVLQDARVPSDLPRYDDVEHELNRLNALADVLQIPAINPEVELGADAIYAAEVEAMTRLGQLSAAEYERSLSEPIAS